MDSTNETKEQQSLCLSCGLCCDGTLFEWVPLESADNLLPLKKAGIKIRIKKKAEVFFQPCPAYQKSCCQIYAARPTNCQKYQCKLLQRVEKGRISRRDAEQKINRALELKESFEKEFERVLPQRGDKLSLSAAQKLMPDNKKMLADPALLKKWGLTMMRLAALLGCLENAFRFSEKTEIKNKKSSAGGEDQSLKSVSPQN